MRLLCVGTTRRSQRSNPAAPIMDTKTEKCYISRDEGSHIIWVWSRPEKGVWSPTNIGGKEFVNFQRADRSLENTSSYIVSDFKKKFGITIPKKTKKCIRLPIKLLNNEDYKLISDDPERNHDEN